MSEPLRIVCRCGYENWVAPEKRGQTVPCFICGDDIVVEGVEESAAPADESPFSAAPSEASAGATLSARLKPRSPFEDDEPEPPARPQAQPALSTSAPASPPPTARPRNPFEADDAEQASPFRPGNEKNFVADPFSRELIPAPKPVPTVADEMEKHRPTERRAQHKVIDTISPHDAPTGEKCMQCGRPIRGGWDRVETHLGVFCYVCSNQATRDVPDRIKTGSGKNELRERDLLVDPVDIRNAPPEQNLGVTGTSSFKKLILWMAWGVLGLAFIVWLTGWGTSTPMPSRIATMGEPDAPMPDFIRYIGWAISSVFGFIGTITAVYLTLDRNGRLPHERFLLNIVAIGAVFVVLGALSIAVGIVGNILGGDDSVVALLWFMVTGIALMILFFYLLMEWLGFELGDFAWLFLFYMPAVQVVIGGIGYFFRWGVYQLVL